MKPVLVLLVIAVPLCITSCSKDGGNVSSQTIALLQHRWTLLSSSLVFPDNATLNSRYEGISTDYYQFGTNDSLIISQSGQVNLPGMPLSLTTKYSFLDNRRITYQITPGMEVNIKVLTNNLLVLSNTATHTVMNSGVVIATYTGTKTDSLSR